MDTARTGRPPVNPKAVAAWRRYRSKARLADIAKAANVSASAVGLWKQVPAERLSAVAEFLGVPAASLRPDLYPEPWTEL